MSEINDMKEIPEYILPINLKFIKAYQRQKPIITAKYTTGTYKKCSFRGGSNIYLKLITCKDKIVIP